MKFITLTIGLLLISFGVFAQINYAENVKIKSVTDEEITITYDIPPNSSIANYVIKVITDDPNITPIRIAGIPDASMGEFQQAGNEIELIWLFSQDTYTRAQVENLGIDVIAYDPAAPDEINICPDRPGLLAGLGVAGAAGIGLIVKGLSDVGNYGENSDLYKNYTAIRNPEDPYFQRTADSLGIEVTSAGARQDLFDFLEKKNRNGSLFAIGGGVVLAAAGALLINRLIVVRNCKQGKYGSNTYYEIRPDVRLGSNLLGSPEMGRSSRFGVNFSLHF